MAKKDDKLEIPPTPTEPDPALKAKVEDKVEKVEKIIEKKTGERENLIGELADPKIDDKFEWAKWSKSVDEKLDRVLANYPQKEPSKMDDPPPTAAEPPPKQPWYEKELF